FSLSGVSGRGRVSHPTLAPWFNSLQEKHLRVVGHLLSGSRGVALAPVGVPGGQLLGKPTEACNRSRLESKLRADGGRNAGGLLAQPFQGAYFRAAFACSSICRSIFWKASRPRSDLRSPSFFNQVRFTGFLK